LDTQQEPGNDPTVAIHNKVVNEPVVAATVAASNAFNQYSYGKLLQYSSNLAQSVAGKIQTSAMVTGAFIIHLRGQFARLHLAGQNFLPNWPAEIVPNFLNN
jgi:hypothetical protein